ncbi:MAG: hypothetical protein ABSH41_05660 [Syntrophobacteraceae bacterium]|jgi:predicted transcriptional regulator
MENKTKDARDFFDTLEEFLGHTADQSTEELARELQEDGVDTAKLVGQVRSIVSSKLDEVRLGWQKEAEEKRKNALVALAATKITEALSKDEIIARIQRIIGSIQGQELSVEYRNVDFDAMTEEDLLDTLIQLETLSNETD